MPRVPSLNQPQVASNEVKLTPRPSVRVEDHSSAEAFGAGIGRAVQGFGEAVTGLGDTLSGIQLDLLRRQNESEARKAEQSWIEYERSALHDPTSGYYAKSGEEAVMGREAAAKALQEKAQEIANGLSNPEARRQYFELISPRLNARMIDIDQFSARHQAAWETAQSEAIVAGAAEDAIADGIGKDGSIHTGKIALHSDIAIKEIYARADREKWPQSVRDQEMEKVQSSIHTGVINRLLQQPGGAVTAQEYYRANYDAIDGHDKKDVEAALKDGVEQATAVGKADAIVERFAKGGVKADDWYSSALKEADETGDLETRDRVRRKIHERYLLAKAAEDADVNSAWEQAIDWVDGGKNPDDLPFGIKDKIGIFKLNELKAAFGFAGRRVTRREGAIFVDQLYEMTDRELASVDVREYRSQLDDDDYEEAKKMVLEAREGLGGSVSKFDPRNAQIRGYLDDTFEAADFLGDGKAEARGRIKLLIVKVLREAAEQKGAALTFDEQTTIVDRLMMNSGQIRDQGNSVRALEAIALTDDVGDIPEDARKDIERVLREKGRAVTEPAIIEVYVRDLLLGSQAGDDDQYAARLRIGGTNE